LTDLGGLLASHGFEIPIASPRHVVRGADLYLYQRTVIRPVENELDETLFSLGHLDSEFSDSAMFTSSLIAMMQSRFNLDQIPPSGDLQMPRK
jgi:hypothetical protein